MNPNTKSSAEESDGLAKERLLSIKAEYIELDQMMANCEDDNRWLMMAKSKIAMTIRQLRKNERDDDATKILEKVAGIPRISINRKPAIDCGQHYMKFTVGNEQPIKVLAEHAQLGEEAAIKERDAILKDKYFPIVLDCEAYMAEYLEFDEIITFKGTSRSKEMKKIEDMA